MGDDETKKEKPRTKDRGNGFTEISLGGEQEQKPVESGEEQKPEAPSEEKPEPQPEIQEQEPEPSPVSQEPAPDEPSAPSEPLPERKVPEILEVRRPEEPRPEPETPKPSEPVEPTPEELPKPKLELSDLVRQKREDASKDVLPTEPKPFRPLQLPRRQTPEEQATPPESPSQLHERVYEQVQSEQENQPGLLDRVKKLLKLG